MELLDHAQFSFVIRHGYLTPSGPNGETSFVQPFNKKGLKLYIISCGGTPFYVGKTTQPMQVRLNRGINPTSRNPYGYLWRHHIAEATIDVWLLSVVDRDIEAMGEDPSIQLARGDEEKQIDVVIETLEAEVALLVRQRFGQWPRYQSEIHFHQSGPEHRELANEIVSHYRRA